MNLKTISNFIGKGSYGKVYKIDDNQVQKELLFISNDHIKDSCLREIVFYRTILSCTKPNPNISSLRFDSPLPQSLSFIEQVQIGYKNTGIFIIRMPFLGPSLSKNKLSIKHCLQVAHHVIEGIFWLHSHGLSHGDIKPENICYNVDTQTASIIDYGSICFNHQIKQERQRCTLYYVSPEECKKNSDHFYQSTDIWSLGIVLFELYTGKNLIHQLMLKNGYSIDDVFSFHDKAVNEPDEAIIFLQKFLQQIKYINIYEILNENINHPNLFRIISHCLLLDTKLRITSQELIQLFYSLNNTIKDEIPVYSFDKTRLYNYKFYKDNKKYDTNETQIYSYDQRTHAINYMIKLCDLYPGYFDLRLLPFAMMNLDRMMFRSVVHEYNFDDVISINFMLIMNLYNTQTYDQFIIEQVCNIKCYKDIIYKIFLNLDFLLFCIPFNIFDEKTLGSINSIKNIDHKIIEHMQHYIQLHPYVYYNQTKYFSILNGTVK